MKFRFCGDGDCPDWILAEIHSSLSTLSSIKLKILAQMVIKSILGQHIPDDKLKETFAANKFDLTQIKAGFACLRYLIVNAIRYNADEAVVEAELQQLGLPKEHSAAVCRVMQDNYTKIHDYLTENSLKVNEFKGVSYSLPKDTIGCAQLSIDIANEIVDGIPSKVTHKINISKSDIPILLNELKTVRDLIDSFDDSNEAKSSAPAIDTKSPAKALSTE